MWSDSMIVIQRICSSAQRWKQFVINRLTEIQSLNPPKTWSHCSGKLNPADLTTRSQTVSKLTEEELWCSGPPFLSSVVQPEPSDKELCEEEIMAELKSNHVTVQMSNTDNIPPDPLSKLESYSKLRTVLRVTAWIKRFIHNSCSKEKDKES